MRPIFALALVSLVFAAGAAAANPDLVYLEKTLKTAMVKKLKTEAPKLKIATVTCVLPKSGVKSKCIAHFTDAGVKGYYPVSATLHANGKLTWTAQSPKCMYPKSKKYTAC